MKSGFCFGENWNKESRRILYGVLLLSTFFCFVFTTFIASKINATEKGILKEYTPGTSEEHVKMTVYDDYSCVIESTTSDPGQIPEEWNEYFKTTDDKELLRKIRSLSFKNKVYAPKNMYDFFRFMDDQQCSNKVLQTLDLTNLDTSKTEDMSSLFAGLEALKTLNLGITFYTSNVKKMSSMFAGCLELTTIDLGDKFDTSNVTSMEYMFNLCQKLTTLNLGDKFDTSNVKSVRGMFSKCNSMKSFNLGDKFTTIEAKNNCNLMFYQCSSLESIDCRKKIYLYGNYDSTFAECSSLKTIMLNDEVMVRDNHNPPYGFLLDCTALTDVKVGDYSSSKLTLNDDGTEFDSILVTALDKAYYNYALADGKTNIGAEYNEFVNRLYDIAYDLQWYKKNSDGTSTKVVGQTSDTLSIDLVLENSGEYYLHVVEKYGPYQVYAGKIISELDTPCVNVEIEQRIFDIGTTPNTVKGVLEDDGTFIISSVNPESVGSIDDSWKRNMPDEKVDRIRKIKFGNKVLSNKSAADMFYGLSNLIQIDLTNFDTTNATRMDRMFANLNNLETLNLGNTFNTSNVEDMSFMFYNCIKLETLDLGEYFDTSNVYNMLYMFQNDNKLRELNLGKKFNTSKVQNFGYFLNNCNSLETIDLGENFDTSRATAINWMFGGCSSLKTLDLGEKFVTDGNSIFYPDMFSGCEKLQTLKFSDGFANDTNYDNRNLFLFSTCPELTTIEGGRLTKVTTTKIQKNESEIFNHVILVKTSNLNHEYDQCREDFTLDVRSVDMVVSENRLSQRYQWYKYDENGSLQEIEGATEQTLSLLKYPKNAGKYVARVRQYDAKYIQEGREDLYTYTDAYSKDIDVVINPVTQYRNFTVKTSSLNGASGETTPSGTINAEEEKDQEVIITLPKHTLARIYVNGKFEREILESTSYTVNNVLEDTEVKVEFDKIYKTLTIEKEVKNEAGGDINISDASIKVEEGSNKEIEVTIPENEKVNIYVDGTLDRTLTQSSNYTLENILSDKKIKFEFDKIYQKITLIKEFKNGAGGDVNIADEFVMTKRGGTQNIEVILPLHTKASIYVNDKFKCEIKTSDTYTIENVLEDSTFKVVFDKIYVKLTLEEVYENGGCGNINTSDKTIMVEEGSSPSVGIVIGENSQASVSINDATPITVLETRDVTVPNISMDTKIKAVFTRPKVDLTIISEVDDGASGDFEAVTKLNEVFKGDKVIINVTLGENSIAKLYMDDMIVAQMPTSNSYTIEHLLENKTLKIKFEKKSATVDIEKIYNNNSVGDIEVLNSNIYYGDDINLDITLDSNSTVTLYKDGNELEKINSSKRFIVSNVTENTKIKAVFDKKVKKITVIKEIKNGASGNVSPNENVTAIAGTDKEFDIVPDANSKANIYVNGFLADELYNIRKYVVSNIIDNIEFKVIFDREEMDVKIDTQFLNSAKGSVAIQNKDKIFKGDSCNLMIKFDDATKATIYVNGSFFRILETDETFDLGNITSDKNVKVVFDKEEKDIAKKKKEQKKEEPKKEEPKKEENKGSSTTKRKSKAYIEGYKNGTFAPDNDITRCEIATVIARISDKYNDSENYKKDIVDVKKTNWASNYIGFMLSENLMDEDKNGKFNPSGEITRGEIAKIICIACDINEENEDANEDVKLDGSPIYETKDEVEIKTNEDYLKVLEKKGYITGLGNGILGDTKKMTRAEVVTLLNKVMGKKTNIELTEKQFNELKSRFSDINNIKAWYLKDVYVATMQENSFMQ